MTGGNEMTENQAIETPIRHGLDIQKFRDFCGFAKENPRDVMFDLEATGVAEDRAVHTLATTGAYSVGGQRIDRLARRYSYHFGAHKEVEEALGFVEPTDRKEVIEVALAALTGCINAVISVGAAVRGIDLRAVQTDVQVSWDPAVFLYARDAEKEGQLVNQFGDLQIELTLTGDSLSKDDVTFLEKTVKRSAVFNLIASAHNHRIRVTQANNERASA
jgi:hypothetical protein